MQDERSSKAKPLSKFRYSFICKCIKSAYRLISYGTVGLPAGRAVLAGIRLGYTHERCDKQARSGSRLFQSKAGNGSSSHLEAAFDSLLAATSAPGASLKAELACAVFVDSLTA